MSKACFFYKFPPVFFVSAPCSIDVHMYICFKSYNSQKEFVYMERLMKTQILMDEYSIPWEETRYVFRISKFVMLTFFPILVIALASCYLHILSTAKKYKRPFDEVCVDFLRCANKECECSYQDAKNDNLKNAYFFINIIIRNSKDENPLRVYIQLSKFNFSSVCPFKLLTSCAGLTYPLTSSTLSTRIYPCLKD